MTVSVPLIGMPLWFLLIYGVIFSLISSLDVSLWCILLLWIAHSSSQYSDPFILCILDLTFQYSQPAWKSYYRSSRPALDVECAGSTLKWLVFGLTPVKLELDDAVHELPYRREMWFRLDSHPKIWKTWYSASIYGISALHFMKFTWSPKQIANLSSIECSFVDVQ